MKSSRSALGRLLEEISWEGNARHYRHGGRGFENVLSVEVFQALDFLPRRFLGRIIQSIHGGSPEVRTLFTREVERVKFSVLPGDVFLAKHSPKGTAALSVQPDGVLESPGVYCMVEAKRIKRGSFQPEQLAREFLAVLQEAQGRKGLLLLVLPEPPPVPIKGHGRLSLHKAVTRWLPSVLKRAEHELPPIEQLGRLIPSTLAYITWEQVSNSVRASLKQFSSIPLSPRASVDRLAQAVLDAIEWHT